MQLRPLCAGLALLIALPASARADGELSMRGAYYKEDATRVAQPMMDARLEVGDDGELTAHTLVDAITSASVASGAAGEAFTEIRYEGGLGYAHRFGDVAVGGFGRYSYEPDYTSVFGGVRGQLALAQDNTLVDAAVSLGRDRLSNAGAQGGIGELIRGRLATSLASFGVTQVLSQRVVAGFTYDVIRLEGFQENPYRTVVAGGMLMPERVPEVRWRHAVVGSVRTFVPSVRGTLVGSYRFYADTWGLLAHTPEVRWIQEVRADAAVHLRYRFHRQGAADFYQPIYDSGDPAMEPFITDDPKLSAYTTQTVGLKLELALARLGFGGEVGRWRAEALLEYLHQTNRYGDAVVGQVAITVPLQY